MAASRLFCTTLLSLCALLSSLSAYAQTCKSQKLKNTDPFATCVDLAALGASLHFTFDSSNSSLSIAFVAPPAKPDGWIAWAINPSGEGMVGAQSLVAFKGSDGTMAVKTFDIQSYSKLNEGKLSIDVWDLKSEHENGVMTIFGKVKVPTGMAGSLNHLWQVGPMVTDGRPISHDFAKANLNAKGTLNLNAAGSSVSPAASSSGERDSKMRNTHGLLNTISWGLMFPLGVVFARYLRVFPNHDPLWFNLHISCQLVSYCLGTAGFWTGIVMGRDAPVSAYPLHRNFGIALYCFCSLQMLAFFLRPKKDHKYRTFWNIYHHSVGFTIIILGFINVFIGLEMLQPAKPWKAVYIAVLFILAFIALVLEICTWIVVIKRKKAANITK